MRTRQWPNAPLSLNAGKGLIERKPSKSSYNATLAIGSSGTSTFGVDEIFNFTANADGGSKGGAA